MPANGVRRCAVEYGIALPNIGPFAHREALFTIADTADKLGFDAVWVGDHLSYPNHPSLPYPYSRGSPVYMRSDMPILDPLITLAAVAGRTSRVRLGISVLVLPYRHPLLAAKMLATLDQLSHGRVILGVGSGWIPEEFKAAGAVFQRRGPETDEHIRYYKELWTKENPEFHGQFFEFSDMSFLPKPVQKPHIPVWVGGNMRIALRRAAALADGWHGIDLSPKELAAKLVELREMCAKHARRAQEITVSMRAALRVSKEPVPENGRAHMTGSLEQIATDIQEYKKLGVRHLLLSPRVQDWRESLAFIEAFATQVRPKV